MRYVVTLDGTDDAHRGYFRRYYQAFALVLNSDGAGKTMATVRAETEVKRALFRISEPGDDDTSVPASVLEPRSLKKEPGLQLDLSEPAHKHLRERFEKCLPVWPPLQSDAVADAFDHLKGDGQPEAAAG